MESESLLKKERKTVKRIEISPEVVASLKKDQPKILAQIIKGVNRRNGGQHPLTPPRL